MTLKFFTDPAVLSSVSRRLLAEFFGRFAHLLPKYGLPNPDGELYIFTLAEVMQQPGQFPAPLVDALFTVEDLAAPEKHLSVDPTADDADATRLSEALRLWLHPPPSQTQPPQISTSTASETGPDTKAAPTAVPPPGILSPDSCILDSALSRLARLSLIDYERVRRAEAERLDIRLRTLDTQVARYRSQLDNDAEANAVKLPHLEPWPEPVSGAEVLNQTYDGLTLYLALCPGAADAIALWIAHTHAFRAFHQTPRLNLHSPQGNCGKTTTLEILATMAPRPFTTENMKPAVLFRVVDQQRPTLLLDELDTYLTPANELRGLLNAGHKRGACVYRCEGAGNTIRAFNAFAPAALAGIGPLPVTLRTRSILIPLVSAMEGEIKARFDSNNTETETILGQKLARWAKDNFDAIAACKPSLPPGAFNRLADNWRPLFAIAQIAGGDWPQRAANAFALLTAKPQQAPDLNLLLLADVRSIFAASDAQRLFSSTLVDSLTALPDRPWSAASPPINQTWLARRLAPFDVRPRTIRIGAERAKGYELAYFTKAFTRFLRN